MNRTLIRISCKTGLMLLLATAILGLTMISPCHADVPMAGSKKLDFSDGSIWISPKASNQEVQAARSCRRTSIASRRKSSPSANWPTASPMTRPAIIVGTVKSLPEIAGGFSGASRPTGEGNRRGIRSPHRHAQNGVPTALILANEPIGALYGAYTFLEKFGIGFYLGGDVYPGTQICLAGPRNG